MIRILFPPLWLFGFALGFIGAAFGLFPHVIVAGEWYEYA